MTVTSETAVYYDPYDIGIIADPYPTYARLREEAPIYYNERYDFWALSRYSDVEQALANWKISPAVAVTSSSWFSRNSTCPAA